MLPESCSIAHVFSHAGPRRRRALHEEERAVRAVRVSLHHHGARLDVGQQRRRDRRVIPEEIALRDAQVGPERLAQVGEPAPACRSALTSALSMSAGTSEASGFSGAAAWPRLQCAPAARATRRHELHYRHAFNHTNVRTRSDCARTRELFPDWPGERHRADPCLFWRRVRHPGAGREKRSRRASTLCTLPLRSACSGSWARCASFLLWRAASSRGRRCWRSSR